MVSVQKAKTGTNSALRSRSMILLNKWCHIPEGDRVFG